MISPSTKPHKIATIGIKQVTEEAKIAVVPLTNWLNKTKAIDVPTVDSNTTQNKAKYAPSIVIFSEKSENPNASKQNGPTTKKAKPEISMALISCK